MHGVIMAFCPRGSHHLLRTRFNTRATPSVTIMLAELGGAHESFRECGPHLRGVVLPIGLSCYLHVDIVTCLPFVIQDMQEGDSLLCGSFGTHTSGVQCHCQLYDVQYNHLDDCEIRCIFVEASDMTHIAERSDLATRTQWSQHQLRNAFDCIFC
jgi:hypothetical protein